VSLGKITRVASIQRPQQLWNEPHGLPRHQTQTASHRQLGVTRRFLPESILSVNHLPNSIASDDLAGYSSPLRSHFPYVAGGLSAGLSRGFLRKSHRQLEFQFRAEHVLRQCRRSFAESFTGNIRVRLHFYASYSVSPNALFRRISTIRGPFVNLAQRRRCLWFWRLRERASPYLTSKRRQCAPRLSRQLLRNGRFRTITRRRHNA